MKIAVLLATHNGLPWLQAQVDEILGQRGVNVHLFVSDDASVDGSLAWIRALAKRDERVTVLPEGRSYGSAAKNFYRLLLETDFSAVDYVAFADQDDIWYTDKLARALSLMQARSADAVSSNVMAFWPEGRRKLVDKAQPQQLYDYLFEAAGPGCTYLMNLALVCLVRDQLIQLREDGRALPAHHDWFCYAVCRASGRQWVIDPVPSMDYRQHAGNELGVNSGSIAALSRHAKMFSGGYFREVVGMVRMVRALCQRDEGLEKMAIRLMRGNLLDRLVLVLRVNQFRRRWRDRCVLALYFLSGWFWGRPRVSSKGIYD